MFGLIYYVILFLYILSRMAPSIYSPIDKMSDADAVFRSNGNRS